MSTTDTTTDYEPVTLVHRRTVVEAVRYDGTEHGRRYITGWVEGHGGTALDTWDGRLWVYGRRGPLPVHSDEFVVRGIEVEGRREFFPLDGKFAMLAYTDANGADTSAILDRDQAAALVVAADDLAERRGDMGPESCRVAIAAMAVWVHQLATSAEAMR